MVAGCNNGQIKVYKMTEYPPYNCIQTTQPTTDNPECDPITSMALSQTGKMMVSASTAVSAGDVACLVVCWKCGYLPSSKYLIYKFDILQDTERPHNNCVLWGISDSKTDILEHRHSISGIDHACFSNLSGGLLRKVIITCVHGSSAKLLSHIITIDHY